MCKRGIGWSFIGCRLNGDRDCPHDLSYLGADGGGNEHNLCEKCGTVIIRVSAMGLIEEGKELERMEEPPRLGTGRASIATTNRDLGQLHPLVLNTFKYI